MVMMQTTWRTIGGGVVLALALVLVLAITGCGDGGEGNGAAAGGGAAAGDDGVDEFESAVKSGDKAGAMDALKDINRAGSGKVSIEQMASAARLRAYLPETAAGMQRRSISTSAPEPRSPVLNSSADAMYYPEGAMPFGDTKRVDISITDMGSMAGMARMLERDIDHQEGTRRSKSFTHEGFRGLVQEDSADNSVEIQLLLPNRLLISAGGSGVSADELKKAIAAIDLKTLAQQAQSGELAKPTEEETIELIDPEALKAVLPEQLEGDWKLTGAHGYKSESGDFPFSQMQGNYSDNRNMLSVMIKAYKSQRHAEEAEPATAESFARTAGAGMAKEGDVKSETWNGQTVHLLAVQNYATVARANLGRVIVQVQGQNVELVKSAFEALDLSKLPE